MDAYPIVDKAYLNIFTEGYGHDLRVNVNGVDLPDPVPNKHSRYGEEWDDLEGLYAGYSP
jgi:hypothetical protein